LKRASFGGDGKETTSFGGTDVGASMLIQPDGKIVVVGYKLSGGSYDFAVARYNSDGTLDTGFDSDGKLTTNLGGSSDTGRDVALQSDGKIIVGGSTNASSSNNNFALVRYNTNGSVDTGFGTSGIVNKDLGAVDSGQGIAVQSSDDKIIVVGTSNVGSAHNNFAVARFNSGGSIDNSFDSDGVQTVDFGSTQDSGAAVLIQPDGKIVVVGTANNTFAAARLSSSGSLDNDFDGDGKVTTNTGGFASVMSVARQSDGKIVVAGWTEFVSTNDDFTLVRYNAGSLEQRLYAQQDHNYNVTSLTDTAGTVVQRVVYDPYGAPTFLTASWSSGSNSHSWKYLHQGGRYDTVSGVYHFRNRDYSPTLGRWVRQDPAGYVDGMNLYHALSSNPVTNIDPAGLMPKVSTACVCCYSLLGGFGSGLIAAGTIDFTGWLPGAAYPFIGGVGSLLAAIPFCLKCWSEPPPPPPEDAPGLELIPDAPVHPDEHVSIPPEQIVQSPAYQPSPLEPIWEPIAISGPGVRAPGPGGLGGPVGPGGGPGFPPWFIVIPPIPKPVKPPVVTPGVIGPYFPIGLPCPDCSAPWRPCECKGFGPQA
jgi:uncharacterized delta-60 repeat protein/RHS repeat-associated protein